MTGTLVERYKERLSLIPPPGAGCHRELLAVANLGVMVGLHDHEIFADIRAAIPLGSRKIPDSEITKTISRARREVIPAEQRPDDWKPPPKPKSSLRGKYNADQRAKYIARGAGCGEADFHDLSPIELPPVRFDGAYHADAVTLLRHLYRADEYVFIGSNFAAGPDCVRPVGEWLEMIEANKLHWDACPHIIPNPLTGDTAPTHDGKPSYRSDAAVADRRYCVVEFDDIPREDQFRFWAGAPFPIVALIDSGGKSLHAWLLVNSTSAEHWDEVVRGVLYRQILEPLGVDPACKNPARLSRLPGRLRQEKGKWQRLLYCAPKGVSLCQ